MTEEAHDTSETRHEAHHPLSFTTDPKGYPVTADMARGLMATVRTIRPGWSWNDMATALDQCRDQDPVELTLAFIAAAMNPNVQHPDVIVRAGRWWDAAKTYPPAPEPHVEPVVNLADRRERKERGYESRLEDPAFQEAREKARKIAEDEARARGGYVITEESLR